VQANHVGKVVTTSPAARLGAQVLQSRPPPPAVLITGGTGALGLLTAAWLAGQGFCRLHLAGRSGRVVSASPPLAALLTSAGVAVTLAAADVASASDASALAALNVGAVVHAAGVLADAALPRQTLAVVRRWGMVLAACCLVLLWLFSMKRDCKPPALAAPPWP
jgi:hypothetical protein